MLDGEDAGGTPDLAIWVDFSELHIIDVKGGWEYVSENENDQLRQYALGIIEEYKLSPTEIHLHIFQPGHENAEPWRTTKVSMSELKGYKKTLTERIQFIKKNPGQLLMGSHFQFGKHRFNFTLVTFVLFF